MICVYVHACVRVYLCTFCSYICFLCIFSQNVESRHLNPSAVFIHRFPSCCRGGSGHWALDWWSGLFLLAWLCLSAEALLGECGCSLDVFTPALADCRPNEIQIWELFRFRVWYWHPSRLHRAVTISLNPQDEVFIPAMSEWTQNANRGLVPEVICVCVWVSVRDFAYAHTFTGVYTHLSPHERIITDFDVTARTLDQIFNLINRCLSFHPNIN